MSYEELLRLYYFLDLYYTTLCDSNSDVCRYVLELQVSISDYFRGIDRNI